MIQDKETLRKTDLVFGLILVIAAGFFMYESLKMPWHNLMGTGGGDIYTAPGILPLLVSGIILILGVMLIVGAWREGARIGKKDLKRVIDSFKNIQTIRMLIMAIIIIAYVFGLIGRVSFTWATFFYLAVFMLIFKATKWYLVLIIAALTAFIISYAFGNLVQIPLP